MSSTANFSATRRAFFRRGLTKQAVRRAGFATLRPRGYRSSEGRQHGRARFAHMLYRSTLSSVRISILDGSHHLPQLSQRGGTATRRLQGEPPQRLCAVVERTERGDDHRIPATFVQHAIESVLGAQFLDEPPVIVGVVYALSVASSCFFCRVVARSAKLRAAIDSTLWRISKSARASSTLTVRPPGRGWAVTRPAHLPPGGEALRE